MKVRTPPLQRMMVLGAAAMAEAALGGHDKRKAARCLKGIRFEAETRGGVRFDRGPYGVPSVTPHFTPALLRAAPETSTTDAPPSSRRTDPVINDESSLAR